MSQGNHDRLDILEGVALAEVCHFVDISESFHVRVMRKVREHYFGTFRCIFIPRCRHLKTSRFRCSSCYHWNTIYMHRLVVLGISQCA